jgi:60 kDa SS-A/Ro ribonucleoprotein
VNVANKTLFKSFVGKMIRKPDTHNSEAAPAYAFTAKHALAQYAATGCLNATFYASGEEQLDAVLTQCSRVDPEFIGKAAVYCREKGHMKDMPALLCAVLSVRDRDVFKIVFGRVMTNARMLRTFVQIMRSGAVGRKSLGSLPKRMVEEWLASVSNEELFKASIGNDPSLADIIKMVHPKPRDVYRETLYAYLIGREKSVDVLPDIVKSYESFKSGESLTTPDVPFQMLTALPLSRRDWMEIARNAPWQTTRMNLNTFARHGVFEDAGITRLVAERLRDAKAVRKSRVLPYQLMVAYLNCEEAVPSEVREALQDAMEIAVENAPVIEGRLYVLPDVSGSMTCSAVTGYRKGATSKVRCIDVAALTTAALVRKNPGATVIPFEQKVVKVSINPRDSIMTNAAKLSRIGGGGTNCSAPLALLNERKSGADLVVYISDNQSWVDARSGHGTATMREWNKLKQRNPDARLVCVDIQPYPDTQAYEREDILNVGGFSDQVFDVVSAFAGGRPTPDHWIGVIEQISLN